MCVRKRAIFFENVIQETALSAETLNTRLGEFHHGPTARLRRNLSSCSMAVFENYTRILSVGEATTVSGMTLSSNARNTNTATTIEMEGKAKQRHFKPTNETYFHERDNPRSVCVSDISAIPPSPAYAAKPVDLRLCQLVHNLPPELFDMVLEEFLHAALGPRKLYIGDVRLYIRAFGALNRAMYAKHRGIFLSQSIWVMGEGSCQDTISFLNKMPVSMVRCIRKIEMRFTRHDCVHPSLDHYFVLPDITTPSTDRLDCLLHYMKDCAKLASELLRTWFENFGAIKALEQRFDELVLDVSDAYGPDGDFLGRDFRNAILPPTARDFAGGTPVKFTVLGIDNH